MKKKTYSNLLIVFLALIICLLPGCSKNKDKLGFQLDMPKNGDSIAIMETSMGTMKIRLFPEYAPKAVENFTTLANQGYYNGLIFHRVIENFCVQGGDPKGDGTGGQSIWGKGFEVENCPELVNITGALSMARSNSVNSNGSQFFFNQGGKDNFIGWSQLSSSMNNSKITNEYKDLYNQNGGNPSLDGYYNKKGEGYTVFGQIYEGLDVLNQIAKVKVDSNDKPIDNVTINKVTISEYEG